MKADLIGWTVDLSRCEARHERGLVVSFMEIAGDELRGVARPDCVVHWPSTGESQDTIARRWMREAASVYVKALSRLH